MPNWYPNRGDLDSPEDLERTIRRILDTVYANQEMIPSAAASAKAAIPEVVRQSIPLIKQQLQAGTPHSLNLQGLVGSIIAGSGGANQVVVGINAQGNLVFAQLSASNLSNGVTGTGAVVLASLLGTGPFTVVLAKITGGGANGSLSVNNQGMITAYTPPT